MKKLLYFLLPIISINELYCIAPPYTSSNIIFYHHEQIISQIENRFEKIKNHFCSGCQIFLKDNTIYYKEDGKVKTFEFNDFLYHILNSRIAIIEAQICVLKLNQNKLITELQKVKKIIRIFSLKLDFFRDLCSMNNPDPKIAKKGLTEKSPCEHAEVPNILVHRCLMNLQSNPHLLKPLKDAIQNIDREIKSLVDSITSEIEINKRNDITTQSS